MTKIFKQAKDKNVAKVIVYGHTDSFLYSDAAHTTKLNKSELKDLFLKGCLIKTSSGDLTPVKYLEAETYTGFVAKTDAASASFYSDGYVAPTPSEHLFDENLEFEFDSEYNELVAYGTEEVTIDIDLTKNANIKVTVGETEYKWDNAPWTDISEDVGSTAYVLYDDTKDVKFAYYPEGVEGVYVSCTVFTESEVSGTYKVTIDEVTS